MPAKYVIHHKTAKPRFRPIGKLGIVEWREDCSGCHNCVKRDCIYRLYRDEADTLRDEVGYLDYIYQCKGCLNCVQNCTKNILTRVVNPEFRRLGDAYYTPDLILSTWYQAETGKIPVSGAGYGGPFSGPGFDSMWTDMSEIVRPTRDGIHGREYISTSVDIGRKLPHLEFENGSLQVDPPPLAEIPLPVIFDRIPLHWKRGAVTAAVATAAAEIGTMAILDEANLREGEGSVRGHAIPFLTAPRAATANPAGAAKVVMIPDSPDAMAVQAALKREHPARIVVLRIPAAPDVAGRVADLARDGADAIQLTFDSHGREHGAVRPRHMRDVLRDTHTTLVRKGIRDEVTLIASGGIAAAEHVAKAILCGADMVAIDVPLILALECRLCGECERGQQCPIALDEIDTGFGARRMVNLMAAWHSQLLEMLGAMGIREVRRLRGETGRCMFFEDLERETFGRWFGKRTKDS
jgi:ferredoxin